MATRIAWLLNLDADLELQQPATYRGRALPMARIVELRARMFDLVSDDDLILDAATDAREVRSSDVIEAFCPTPTAVERMVGLGLPAPVAPDLAVLRAVNDRRFCAQLGQTLPNACFVDDMQRLQAQLAIPSPTGTYVIKRAFSFAGRDQRRVKDGVLDDSTRGFCAKSFGQGEGVQVEPWVQRDGDFSLHGYLSGSGALLVGQPRAQHNDAMGRFQHMQSDAPTLRDDERRQLEAELHTTADALRAAGYFGPFGIDAFRYRTPDGALAFNPRCEINARFTMGYPRALLLATLPLKVAVPRP